MSTLLAEGSDRFGELLGGWKWGKADKPTSHLLLVSMGGRWAALTVRT